MFPLDKQLSTLLNAAYPLQPSVIMEQQIDQLWKTVLGEIETEVSKANFFTLFKNTALLSIEDTVATIATPSAMIINLLQKRFSPIIKKALDKQTGKDMQLVFIAKSMTKTTQEKAGPLFIEPHVPMSPLDTSTLQRPLPRVRPDFLFQTIAVSSSNQLAYVSAQTVAKNLGKTYNPLFIYGPVGVGKTHLMQAIANEVYQAAPDRRIIYITSEEFTNEVVEAIRTNDTARMKRRFRSADLLIIDDIQFIAGKDRVQEELFHTFNILIDNASQVVFSSDRPPNEIPKLEKRLSSRFASGLTVDVESPDFEMRTAILLIKARKFGHELPIEAAKVIAEKNQDVRSLEGVLLRVITESTNKHVEITPEFVSEVLGGKQQKDKLRLHPDDIVRYICEHFGIKATQLKGPKRDASLVRARQITMYLLKKELGLTHEEIGNMLGGRDHTTVMHGVEKMERLSTSETKIHEEIMGITKHLSE